jgi:ribosome-binding protein aMBF1 (putative translation factor)
MANATGGRWAQMREQRLQSLEDREKYERTRRVLGTIQSLVEAVDSERECASLSKAALARRIGAHPAAVQRLLRSGPSDPTLQLLLEMMDSLGLELRLDRRVPGSSSAMPAASSSDSQGETGRSPLAV